VCRAAEPCRTGAASAVLMEASTGRVLYEKDAHARRLIASTTKLMTALVAAEHIDDFQRTVKIGPEHMAEGSSMYLRPGEEVTLEALLYGLLLSSGNDAALALAGACAGDVETFVGWMNDKAAALGMADTHFANPNGLDDKDHYSTAYDLALLGRAALANETVAKAAGTKYASVAGRSLVNHNKLLWRCEGCTGLKTGYTQAAGRTLVSSAVREGMTLVCVTLHDPDDWRDHAALYDYGFSAYRLCLLARSGKTVGLVPAAGSLLPAAQAVTQQGVWYPLGRGERVKARFELASRVEAPARQGQTVGRLRFYLEGRVIGETRLVCAGDVPLAGHRESVWERLWGRHRA